MPLPSTRWNDDVRGAAMLQDRLIGWLAVIGSVGCELVDLAVDLIEQRRHLGGIIGVLVRQPMSNDFELQRRIQVASDIGREPDVKRRRAP